MLFFLAWVAQFDILYNLLDVETHGWDLTYNSWEISVGSGNRPKSTKDDVFTKKVLLIVWVLNQFFLVVVMLNFLIALLS